MSLIRVTIKVSLTGASVGTGAGTSVGAGVGTGASVATTTGATVATSATGAGAAQAEITNKPATDALIHNNLLNKKRVPITVEHC